MQAAAQILLSVYRAFKKSPPVMAIRRWEFDRRFARARNVNLFRGVFSTFAEAAASAPSTKFLGYDHEEPAKMYRDRLTRIYPADYPMLYWLREVFRESSSVFDLGGHIGVAYYSYARYLKYPDDHTWTVCDVPAVVKEGELFAREQGKTRLHFTTRMEDCAKADILLTAGALQYIEEPLASVLKRAGTLPKHLLINKVPVHPTSKCVTLQSIGTAFCPYSIFQREEFIASFEALGYRLVDAWETAELSCPIQFHPEHSVWHYSGMYFRRD